MLKVNVVEIELVNYGKGAIDIKFTKENLKDLDINENEENLEYRNSKFNSLTKVIVCDDRIDKALIDYLPNLKIKTESLLDYQSDITLDLYKTAVYLENGMVISTEILGNNVYDAMSELMYELSKIAVQLKYVNQIQIK